MFDSLLIANRGEIAVRIIRACRELGIRSVAVYSEADRSAPHVQLADAAEYIGPALAVDSYLKSERVLEAAHVSRVEAIHPGYGFLAENATFARSVESSGLVFVGPAPETIALMGSKTEARRLMGDAGVPIVPGSVGPVTDPAAAAELARDLGFPVLLKATAGGGGKGMRVVHTVEEMARGLQAAAREATASFGDGSIYLEKYLTRPRHIEYQVLGDAHGDVVHLGARECSVQRRHQKLVEEAPASVLSGDEHERMGNAAVTAARSVAYRGAGTIEFLYQEGSFYFLEMNTRLQVEHPVTEAITGIDLVHEQLRIASGEALGYAQRDVAFQGHAIECRITAEDPFSGFLPSTGTIRRLVLPSGPGVRWDGGVAVGLEVGLHYDSLLGKLIVHGASRGAALRRMSAALGELVIEGVDTSAPFHHRLMAEPDFQAGDLSVAYVDEHLELTVAELTEAERRTLAVVVALLEDDVRRSPSEAGGRAARQPETLSAWQTSVWPWRSEGERPLWLDG